MRDRLTRHSRAAMLAAAAIFSVSGASGQTTPPAPAAATASTYAVGQSVEVREGDTWSKAKVLAREGRRVQIEYDDGTKEWVTADRLRTPGTAGTPAPAAKPADEAAPAAEEEAPKSAAKKPAVNSFPTGATVEVKWGGRWSKAKVTNRRGEWHLIAYDGERGQEWVEPWRIRKIGSSYDIDHASPNRKMFDKIDPPPRDKPGPPPAPRGQEETTNVEWPVTDADFGQARDVAATAITPWGYTPPAEVLPPGRVTERAIALQGGASNDVHERTTSLDINGTSALLVYQGPFDPKQPYAEVVNLGNGQQIARAEFDLATRPMSVASDGKRVAGRGGDKAEGRVDVWDVGGKQAPRHVVSFVAYANTGDFFKDVDRVILLDATHLLTLNTFNAHLICWEVGPGSAKAVWHAKLPNGSAVAVSPDRKTYAVAGGGVLALGNALDGTPLGSIEVPGADALGSLSFRADGRRLCALGGPVLYEFDLESGKRTAALGLPVPLVAGTAHHLAGDQVALMASGGPVVFDVAQRAVLGRFKLEQAQQTDVAADKFVAATKTMDKRRTLCAYTLAGKGKPTPLATIPTAAGTKVTLDVQIEADDATRKAVVDALTKQIAARGWTIADGSDLRVVVRTETGKSEQREYGSGPSFGPFAGPRETVSVTERIVRLSVEAGGKPAWTSQQSSAAGFVLSRKEGQSMQQAADEAGRFRFEFLKTARLPETLFVPIEALPASVPTYTLAAGGVRAE